MESRYKITEAVFTAISGLGACIVFMAACVVSLVSSTLISLFEVVVDICYELHTLYKAREMKWSERVASLFALSVAAVVEFFKESYLNWERLMKPYTEMAHHILRK